MPEKGHDAVELSVAQSESIVTHPCEIRRLVVQERNSLTKRAEAMILLLNHAQHLMSPEERAAVAITALSELLGHAITKSPDLDARYTTIEIAKELGVTADYLRKHVRHLKFEINGERKASCESGKSVYQWHWTECGKEAVIEYINALRRVKGM